MAHPTIFLVVLCATFTSLAQGTSNAYLWRCQNTPIKYPNVWKEAIDLCKMEQQKGFCLSLCVLMKVKALSFNLAFQEAQVKEIIEATVPHLPDTHSVFLDGSRHCMRFVVDTDRSPGCVQNKPFLHCLNLLFHGVCNVLPHHFLFSAEVIPVVVPPPSQILIPQRRPGLFDQILGRKRRSFNN